MKHLWSSETYAALASAIVLLLPIHAWAAEQTEAVSSERVVNAPEKTVYEIIRKLHGGGSCVKPISSTRNQDTNQESFSGLPIIGNANCTYIEDFTALNHIDYHMVESDKLKVFEGSWNLTPEGKQTRVELRARVDTGLRLPFWKQIQHAQTLKDINKRLQLVQRTAENTQTQ